MALAAYIDSEGTPSFGMKVSVLALECDRSSVLAQIGQTKDYKIGICCFSAKHAALKRERK